MVSIIVKITNIGMILKLLVQILRNLKQENHRKIKQNNKTYSDASLNLDFPKTSSYGILYGRISFVKKVIQRSKRWEK